MKKEIPAEELMRFLACMLLMNVEVASIAYLISATSSKTRMGLALGVSLIIYTYDIMGRVIPSMKDYLFLGPFSYVNASEIFAHMDAPEYSFTVAAAVVVLTIVMTYVTYVKKDLAC